MPMKRRAAASADRPATSVDLRADEFRGRWPGLWEFLVEVAYEDGSPRQTGTLLLFCEAGVAKVRLCDRDAALVGWFSGRGFEEALEAANEGVEHQSGDWRPDAAKGRRKSS